jgi:hypothetical protein
VEPLKAVESQGRKGRKEKDVKLSRPAEKKKPLRTLRFNLFHPLSSYPAL